MTQASATHSVATAAKPLDSGCRVPYAVFTEPAFYAREQEKIFRGAHWSFVALEAEIPKPGDYKTTFVGDTPVIVTRAPDGKVHTVVNRCAHRGAVLARDLRGNRQTLECVYHQWCFSLDGALVGLPFRRGIKGQGGMRPISTCASTICSACALSCCTGSSLRPSRPRRRPWPNTWGPW